MVVQGAQDDDGISYCGSFHGETFSSRQGRRKPRSAKQQLQDSLALELKGNASPIISRNAASIARIENSKARRWNTCFHQIRILVVLAGGAAYGLILALRYNVSVAILKMVNQEALYLKLHQNSTSQDFLDQGFLPGGDFLWDNEIQQMIMSWYMFTYTLPQVFTTKLGLKIGIRYAIPTCITICSIVTILTPMAAYMGGWQWVIVLRLLNGLGASALQPLTLNLIETWMPRDELFFGISCFGSMYAVFSSLTHIAAGYLCDIHWVYAFYGFGGVGLIFSFIWIFVITKPEHSKLVSEKELNHITESMEEDGKVTDNPNSTFQDVPARTWDVFLVPSFYAYLVIWICHACLFNNVVFILPIFLRQFLKITVADDGIYCTLISLGQVVGFLWPHPVLKILKKNFDLGMTPASWIVMVISCISTSSIWFYIGLKHENNMPLMITLWTISRGFQMSAELAVKGFIMSSYSKTGIASVVFSMINTVGNLAVVVSSTATGYVLDKTGQSDEGWAGILWSQSAANLIMMLIFCLFTRSETIELRAQKKARQDYEAKRRRYLDPVLE